MKRLTLLILLALISMLFQVPAAARDTSQLSATDFIQIGVQGLDATDPANARQNTWAWAMSWWHGHLYVGTNRAWACASEAAVSLSGAPVPYPPNDPDVYCPGAPDPAALPLQAEIWRWTAPNTWERVYRSPNSSLIPGTGAGTGKPPQYTAREIGFRGMLPFTEPDGTDALYITSCSPRFIWSALPPPTILRTTDGVTFTPLPQDPGTTLGTIARACFRNPVSYNGHFFVQAGTVKGAGEVYEAADPAAGNNNFQQVSPADLMVSALGTFNNKLYLGVRDLTNGYAVYRTDATGPTPYTLTPIITNAGYMPSPLNVEVLSMKVFQNHLYVGLNGANGIGVTDPSSPSVPAELIRINPDDSWDLVAGATRMLPDGTIKSPLSGLAAGFGNQYNLHMWRMEVFDDHLYVGTFDASTMFKNEPSIAPSLQPGMGFDLYTSADGLTFSPITTTGFGDMFNFGARTLVATPYGLFVGSTNNWYGLKVHLGTPSGYQGFQVQLPIVY